MKPPPFSYYTPASVQEAVALLGSLDNARVLAGEQTNAGDIRQGAMERANGMCELRERDDGRAGVRFEQPTQGIGPCSVCPRGLLMVFSEQCQRLEMRFHTLDQRCALHFVIRHELGKRELHFMIAHQPTPQLDLRGMSTGAQRLP